MPIMLLSGIHGNRKTTFAMFKQPASKVEEAEIYDHRSLDSFSYGIHCNYKCGVNEKPTGLHHLVPAGGLRLDEAI
ncbi:Hypothetical protein PHPALM_19867 [Phytophthora palmivora]|uniref:Uncharacterized protein n=1 Tax=Phytophthora palmivora TaxID=4796 RepID=A0A2P4XGD0_9STRA|nr:Hypothetical protein PHPALM_19867 [Phytophthora palmivora]